jgi:hypothetical protein
VHGKGTEDLLLLLVGNLKVVERSRELGGDFVELQSGKPPEVVGVPFAES